MVWIGFIVSWLVRFWWWKFEWATLGMDVDFRLCSFLVLTAVSLFLLAAIRVPHHLAVVADSRGRFLSIRPWFSAGLPALNVLACCEMLVLGGR